MARDALAGLAMVDIRNNHPYSPGYVYDLGREGGEMYCTDCGQSVDRDRFGNLIHDYQDHDGHTPVVEDE